MTTPNMNNLLQEKAMPGLHEAVLQTLCEFARPGDSVLDIAAGTGALSERLLGMGFHVAANDLDRQSWGLATIDLLSVDLNDHFSANFQHKGIRPKHILAVEVIEHLENPLAFLRECRKLIQSDGVLLVTTPNINTIRGRIRFLMRGRFPYFNEENYWPNGHISILPWWLLLRHGKSAGFSKCELRFGGSMKVNGGFREFIVRTICSMAILGGPGRRSELLRGCSIILMRP